MNSGTVPAIGKRPALKEISEKTGMIVGTVIGLQSKGICKDAQVFLLQGPFHERSLVASISPDSLGMFKFGEIKPGKYDVVISCSATAGDEVTRVRVASDSASIVTLVVEPNGSMIPEKWPKGWGGQIVPIKDLDSNKEK